MQKKKGKRKEREKDAHPSNRLISTIHIATQDPVSVLTHDCILTLTSLERHDIKEEMIYLTLLSSIWVLSSFHFLKRKNCCFCSHSSVFHYFWNKGIAQIYNIGYSRVAPRKDLHGHIWESSQNQKPSQWKQENSVEVRMKTCFKAWPLV